MRLINIQQANRHFICPVIYITIHFDINDRQAARKPQGPSRLADLIKVMIGKL